MANDGSRWVTSEDVIEFDINMLERLWVERENILDEAVHKESISSFKTGDKRVFYTGCYCADCLMTNERLDVAQAELEVAYKTVAITSEIADGSMAPAWQRVQAWFEKHQSKLPRQLQSAHTENLKGDPGGRKRR